MEKHILCLNSGSSSIKFALYRLGAGEELVIKGAIERIGMAGSWLWLKDATGKRITDRIQDFPTHGAAVKAILTGIMEENRLPPPDGVGHRVVHGGPEHTAHEVVTPELIFTLRRFIPFAPLHMPAEILGIDAVAGQYPDLGQVACFDTAFHRSIPEIARRLPMTRTLWHEGVCRYGFHGLSYEYIVAALGDNARGRVIVAHLGNGASMAALRDGSSVDTTMGFTPTGGLMMGTRSGDLDPGILIFLMEEKGYDASQFNKLLNHRSGLIGVSGISPDMKTLLEKRESEPHAAQAIEMYGYHARKAIGALSAVLGGLDGLVFTGGIGERAAPVRALICQGLDYLGIRLDPGKNESHAPLISADGTRCAVRVIPTNEDLVIARHTRRLLFP
ncbi:MAG: acetate/propionate family kinase [Deltaproteobacteria bacterium]|nr:acetate/propionate family kinase [Deltaproteobacteria bacterium]